MDKQEQEVTAEGRPEQAPPSALGEMWGKFKTDRWPEIARKTERHIKEASYILRWPVLLYACAHFWIKALAPIPFREIFAAGRMSLYLTVFAGIIAMIQAFALAVYKNLKRDPPISLEIGASVVLCIVIGAAAFSGFVQSENATNETLAGIGKTLGAVNETLKTVTGGDSLPTVTPKISRGRLQFLVENNGNYGIYDLSAEVKYQEWITARRKRFEISKQKYASEDFWRGPILTLKIKNLCKLGGRELQLYEEALTPHLVGNEIRFDLPEMNFNFAFEARNGGSSNHLKMVKRGNKYR